MLNYFYLIIPTKNKSKRPKHQKCISLSCGIFQGLEIIKTELGNTVSAKILEFVNFVREIIKNNNKYLS